MEDVIETLKSGQKAQSEFIKEMFNMQIALITKQLDDLKAEKVHTHDIMFEKIRKLEDASITKTADHEFIRKVIQEDEVYGWVKGKMNEHSRVATGVKIALSIPSLYILYKVVYHVLGEVK